MKLDTKARIFLLLICYIYFAGNAGDASPYDYSASLECLAEPGKAQFGGGILINPEFKNGTDGWVGFGTAEIEERSSKSGNRFVVAHNRARPFDSVSQKVHLDKGKLYTLSAWIQTSEGSETVKAIFKLANGKYKHAGATIAKSGCWSMFKGGLTADVSGPAVLYFEIKNIAVEIWIDNVSLQPFTQEQWRAHQTESIERVRKKRLRIHATNTKGEDMAGATVSIERINPYFKFGCASSKSILNNTAYQNWFTSRFTATTFENELKWYSNEVQRGVEDYSAADAMLALMKQHGIAVRGHSVFWDKDKYQLPWVTTLTTQELRDATAKRLKSVVSRYAGQLISWDVVNENIHFHYFEDKLGATASAEFYKGAQQLDPMNTMFLNEYNTIEDSRDQVVTPVKYLQKMYEIKSFPGNEGLLLGIGLQGHFHTPDIAYMRSSLDLLGETKLPIWITELDVSAGPNQAQYLEQVLREAHSHPAVRGIILWSAWNPWGCYSMCLTDNNFKNFPTGDVVDKLIAEWRTRRVVGSTDSNGSFEIPVFHGEYIITLTNPITNTTSTRNVNVTDEFGEEQGKVQRVQIYT